MLTEKQEEILEAIWANQERKHYSIDFIRSRCAVEFSQEDIEELEEQGLLLKNGNKLLFSSEGKKIGEQVIRRHRLAEVMLFSILRLRNSEMEKVACKIEHCLLPEVEESICTLLGHPEMCPDGKPIPPGPCCKRKETVVASTVMSLTDLKPGETGKIVFIRPDQHEEMHQLISFGLRPGVAVQVHRIKPAFCVKFENTELAMAKEIASRVFVWKVSCSLQ